jgi:single-stranded DNA-binding protein
LVIGVNKVQLLGRIGNTPKEFTSPTTGKRMVAFALATSNSYKTKDGSGSGKPFLSCKPLM